MGKRLLSILFAAMAVAGIFAFLVYRVIASHTSSEKPLSSVRLAATKTDIKLGTILQATDLAVVEVVGTLPKGAILDKDKSTLVNRGVTSDLYQGEPILESRLAPPGSGGGLAPTIPNGMRACAVKVDDVVGVAGFATPGMHVDVLFSGVPPAAPGKENNINPSIVTRTVLQDIQVLSAGTDYQRDAEGKAHPVQVVNLLVTPEQAELLSLASNAVTIRLVLRNPMDRAIVNVPTSALSNIFEDGSKPVATPVKKAAPRPAKAPEAYTVEVFSGSTVKSEKLGNSEGKQ